MVNVGPWERHALANPVPFLFFWTAAVALLLHAVLMTIFGLNLAHRLGSRFARKFSFCLATWLPPSHDHDEQSNDYDDPQAHEDGMLELTTTMEIGVDPIQTVPMRQITNEVECLSQVEKRVRAQSPGSSSKDNASSSADVFLAAKSELDLAKAETEKRKNSLRSEEEMLGAALAEAEAAEAAARRASVAAAASVDRAMKAMAAAEGKAAHARKEAEKRRSSINAKVEAVSALEQQSEAAEAEARAAARALIMDEARQMAELEREQASAQAAKEEAAKKEKEHKKASKQLGKEVDKAVGVLGCAREQLQEMGKKMLVAPPADSRFSSELRSLFFGRMTDAVLGIEKFMCVSRNDVRSGMIEGLPALRREFELHGTEEDKLCMRYVLDMEAGTWDKVFPNGNLKCDCDESGKVHSGREVEGESDVRRGKFLADFVAHEKSRIADLEEAEVAALRIYTTAAFRSINNPLRDQDRLQRGEPHKLPLTVALIAQSVGKLRAVEAGTANANETVELYRGMQNVTLPAEFMDKGGTELSPMSTTADLAIAMSYSASKEGVLFRLVTHSSVERGADLTYLSCFPGEREYLFPPLTYLQPCKPARGKKITLAGATFTVLDVEPRS